MTYQQTDIISVRSHRDRRMTQLSRSHRRHCCCSRCMRKLIERGSAVTDAIWRLPTEVVKEVHRPSRVARCTGRDDVTGRRWGEGKGPISASPYLRPPAVFAFTRPDGGRRRGASTAWHCWLPDHTHTVTVRASITWLGMVLGKPDIRILSG